MQKKRTVKHTLMQKNKKNTMMQKKGNEKHTIIKKNYDYMIMQTIKWETRNYTKAKKEAAHRYICRANKNKQNRK